MRLIVTVHGHNTIQFDGDFMTLVWGFVEAGFSVAHLDKETAELHGTRPDSIVEIVRADEPAHDDETAGKE